MGNLQFIFMRIKCGWYVVVYMLASDSFVWIYVYMILQSVVLFFLFLVKHVDNCWTDEEQKAWGGWCYILIYSYCFSFAFVTYIKERGYCMLNLYIENDCVQFGNLTLVLGLEYIYLDRVFVLKKKDDFIKSEFSCTKDVQDVLAIPYYNTLNLYILYSKSPRTRL